MVASYQTGPWTCLSQHHPASSASYHILQSTVLLGLQVVSVVALHPYLPFHPPRPFPPHSFLPHP